MALLTGSRSWSGPAPRLLGWIAGEIMIEDPRDRGYLGAEMVHRFNIGRPRPARSSWWRSAGYIRRRKHLR